MCACIELVCVCGQVRGSLEELQLDLNRMPRAVHASAAWIAADAAVKKHKAAMETVKSLLSDTLKDRHWKLVCSPLCVFCTSLCVCVLHKFVCVYGWLVVFPV